MRRIQLYVVNKSNYGKQIQYSQKYLQERELRLREKMMN